MGRYKPDPDLDFRGIIESIPTIVFITEAIPDCAWTYVNEWIKPILGFTVDEWLSTAGAWERQVHPDDRERVFANESQEVEQFAAAAGGHERRGMFYDDYRMLHKDGHTVWVRDSSMLIATASGRLYWHGILFDISDQKLVEQALERRSAAQTAVADLGEHGLSGMPIEKLLKEACRSAKTVLGADAAAIVSAAPSAAEGLEIVAEHGWATPDVTPSKVPIGSRPCITHALSTAQPVLVEDWEQERRFRLSDTMAARGVRSTVGVRIEGATEPWGLFGSSPGSRTASTTPTSPSSNRWQTSSPTRSRARPVRRRCSTGRCTTRSPDCRTACCSPTASNRRSSAHAGTRARSRRCCSSTSTISSRPTTRSATTPATSCWRAWPSALREAVRPNDTVARFGGDEFGLLLDDIASERFAITTRADRRQLHAAVPAGRQPPVRDRQHRHRPGRRAAGRARAAARRGPLDVPGQGARAGAV